LAIVQFDRHLHKTNKFDKVKQPIHKAVFMVHVDKTVFRFIKPVKA